MEEVERSGWVSEHQDTELDIEFLNVQHILDAEVDESFSDGNEHVSLSNVFNIKGDMLYLQKVWRKVRRNTVWGIMGFRYLFNKYNQK